MSPNHHVRSLTGSAASGIGLVLLVLTLLIPPSAGADTATPMIVQATDLATAVELVESVGGVVTHELGVIRSVGAQLTREQKLELAAAPGFVRTFADRSLDLAGGAGGSCLPTLDFELAANGNPLVRGQVIDDEYADLGITVTTDDPVNHPAMVFDSAAPTGGDFDLGSPHADFGGPGVGAAGGVGLPGENSLPLGKILIASEDGDSSDPDDDQTARTLIFYFDQPTQVVSVGLLDIDETTATVNAFDESGNLIATTSTQAFGKNSIQTLPVGVDNARRLEIFLPSAGGLTAIDLCEDPAVGAVNVRDEFSARSFNNNQGAVNWFSSWVEDDPPAYGGSAGPLLGQVRVIDGELRLSDQPNTGGTPGAARLVSLEGAESATLTFDFRTSAGVDTSDAVEVAVSADGGANFSVLETLTGIAGVNVGARTFDLLPWATADTTVRFRVTSYYGGGNEYFFVDNVDIAFVLPAATPDPPAPTTAAVYDEFNIAAFTNNDGTADWATDWIENDPASGGSGCTQGRIRVTGSGLALNDYPNTGGEPSAARSVDLSGEVVSAVLSFDYKTSAGVDPSDEVVVEVSNNGGATFSILETITGIRGATSGAKSFDITAFKSADTRVRFRVTRYYGGGNEDFFADNVRVEYEREDDDMWVVLDSTAEASYGNSDGSIDWAGDWSEIGENNGPATGKVRLKAWGFARGLKIRSAGRGAERGVDLAGMSNALLEIEYRSSILESESGHLSILMSGDGGVSWTELGRIEGSTEGNEIAELAFDVSSYLSAQTRLRFVNSETMGQYDWVSIRAVQISGTYIVGPGPSLTDSPVVAPYSDFPSLIGADLMHNQGITGAGVTVAVLDTGLWPWHTLTENTAGGSKLAMRYDAITNRAHRGADGFGHGTHVSSIIVDSAQGTGGGGAYNGIAPDAGLVAVKAFDDEGRGSYLSVIRGIDWIVANKDFYDIRVLNLSFSTPPMSHYWEDPLNQAVMAAWDAGIVVVASAGNTGPDAMTVGVPGNVPYIITVGAMSDGVTPTHGGDDFLTSFSSAGPTYEGFVKPEVVAPGGHILGVVDPTSAIPSAYSEYLSGNYFMMSGTSQAAAVVSGAAALLLQDQPYLSPDQVKCRLMDTARPAIDANGELTYSVFQQGAGLVNAFDASGSTADGCANSGLDLAADLAGIDHYRGRANQDEDGNYYLEGLAGFAWSDGFMWNDAFAWSDGFVWSDGFAWSDGFVWSDGFMWSDGFAWSDSFVWSDNLTESASVNEWVEQE